MMSVRPHASCDGVCESLVYSYFHDAPIELRRNTMVWGLGVDRFVFVEMQPSVAAWQRQSLFGIVPSQNTEVALACPRELQTDMHFAQMQQRGLVSSIRQTETMHA